MASRAVNLKHMSTEWIKATLDDRYCMSPGRIDMEQQKEELQEVLWERNEKEKAREEKQQEKEMIIHDYVEFDQSSYVERNIMEQWREAAFQYSTQEIARMSGMTQSAVWRSVYQARKLSMKDITKLEKAGIIDASRWS